MDATEVTAAAFWSDLAPRVLAPPRLVAEGAELQGLLGEEDAIVFATSGSSGQPKWIRLRRDALLASAEAVNRHLEVAKSDVWMLALPLFHVGGFGVAARAYTGGCGLRQFSGRWNAMRFADELREWGVTLTSLVPTQVHDLVECDLPSPPSLRAVVVGGAPLDAVLGQAARDLGWPVLQSYGMTETASQVATDSLAKLGGEFQSAPLPVLPIWEPRIGADGCLQLKGEALSDVCLRLEKGRLVQDALHDEGGWFATRDLAELSSAGLTVTGRADRQVKILGELVDAQALEEELLGHLSQGAEVRILILPDERRGWRLVPVIGTEEPGAHDVVALVNERLPGFARLDAPRLVPKLPRTALGKIDEAALRSEIEGRRSS